MSRFVEKGTQIIKEAIDQDNGGQYRKALQLYKQGIQYFTTGMKYEKNQNIIDVIKEKMTTILTRSETLQQLIHSNDIHTDTQNTSVSNHSLSAPTSHTMYSNNPFTKIEQKSIHLVFGFCRNTEKVLNKHIPIEITTVLTKYYHIHPCEIIRISTVKWSDIGGLKHAKRMLKEALILPLRFPQLFRRRLPWRGILLFGANGSGKLYLLKGCINEITTPEVTTFNVSLKHLTSTYSDEGDRMIKRIYEMATEKSPSIVCLRGIHHVSGTNPSQRRVKTEILVQIHACARIDATVITICITDEPWNLDAAIRKRLPKRIYVSLPDNNARKDVFKVHIDSLPIKNNLSDDDYETLSEKTNGFSCYDIYVIVQTVYRSQLTSASLDMMDVTRIIRNSKTKPLIPEEHIQRLQEWQKMFGPEM